MYADLHTMSIKFSSGFEILKFISVHNNPFYMHFAVKYTWGVK